MTEFLELVALIAFVVILTPLLLAGVIGSTVVWDRLDASQGMRTSGATAGGVTDDRNSAPCAVDDRVTDRAEQHSLERTPSAGTDDHHARVGRGVDQGELCGAVLDESRECQLGMGLPQPVRGRRGDVLGCGS
jgi:hypothetical protein